MDTSQNLASTSGFVIECMQYFVQSVMVEFKFMPDHRQLIATLHNSEFRIQTPKLA